MKGCRFEGSNTSSKMDAIPIRPREKRRMFLVAVEDSTVQLQNNN